MKLLKKLKDGGPQSSVTGYFLVQIKSLFSVVLLRFDGQSRQAYHTHAFNCLSWVLKGKLLERMLSGQIHTYSASFKPFITSREDSHKVSSVPQTSWVLSFRGPWADEWKQYLPEQKKQVTLTHGRQIVNDQK